LKVSIHCEGCKKKVKKVLHSIEGACYSVSQILEKTDLKYLKNEDEL
jgi:copper chaperone CopZ